MSKTVGKREAGKQQHETKEIGDARHIRDI